MKFVFQVEECIMFAFPTIAPSENRIIHRWKYHVFDSLYINWIIRFVLRHSTIPLHYYLL